MKRYTKEELSKFLEKDADLTGVDLNGQPLWATSNNVPKIRGIACLSQFTPYYNNATLELKGIDMYIEEWLELTDKQIANIHGPESVPHWNNWKGVLHKLILTCESTVR